MEALVHTRIGGMEPRPGADPGRPGYESGVGTVLRGKLCWAVPEGRLGHPLPRPKWTQQVGGAAETCTRDYGLWARRDGYFTTAL
jgi:hypothetical protein